MSAASGMNRMPSRKRIERAGNEGRSLRSAPTYGTSCKVCVVWAATAAGETGSGKVVPPYQAGH